MNRKIRVKFTSKGFCAADIGIWLRQFPGLLPQWGCCEFLFDPGESNYDWVVVYDDVGSERDGAFSKQQELYCDTNRTLLVTTEPSSIKTYGDDFLNQFSVIITSQESWAIPQAGAVHTQPGLRWFHGNSPNRRITWDEMQSNPPSAKSALISTVCSSKQHRQTLHQLRYRFTQYLQAQIPQLEVFGHGVRLIDDKADALDPYRYHVAVENHVAEHHWTEKLADSFLGLTLPFYHGCPNVAQYFPEESYIPIDINDFERAISQIRAAIDQNAWEKRLPYIYEARRRVLEEYNLFAVLSREIEKRHDESRQSENSTQLLSRRSVRTQSIGHLIRFARDKWRTKRLLNKSDRRRKAA